MKKENNFIMNGPIEWLICDDNPAIKYRTLVDICGELPQNCQDDYDAIWNHKSVVKLFLKQDENGLWPHVEKITNLSYEYLTVCAELGLYKNERLNNYVDFILKNIMDYANKNDDYLGCRFPLMLRALIMMGYHERNDVINLISRYAAGQLYDGGFNCERLLKQKPARKSCYKAAVQGLLLYAECKRKNILPENADSLINYFLKRDVFYSSDMTKRFTDGKVGWRYIDNFFPAEPVRVGLPLIVYALSVLGVGNHPALSESWEMLKKKKDENGRLPLEGTLSKFPYNFGKIGKENKWMTYYALLAEKYQERSV
jgi:hypothetical protein